MTTKREGGDWYQQLAEENLRLRSSERFVGLAETFRDIGEKIKIDFRSSQSIAHRGDKGTARENVLRGFLQEGGYLPRRYAVSEASSTVLSTTGHMSGQLDLLLYDSLNAPRLLSVGGIQYFPVECAYGVIESKSDIRSAAVVHEALDQIASFKRLRPRVGASLAQPLGFGVVFGFSASLAWPKIFQAVEDWEAKHDRPEWANMIVVLDQGIIAHVDQRILLQTEQIVKSEPKLHPVALGENVMLNFYLLLLDLLSGIALPQAPLHNYVWLPQTAGADSYSFTFGIIHEVRSCDLHGEFLRKISPEAMRKILAACPTGSEINGSLAVDEAYGGASLSLPPQRVAIYNPDGLPWNRLLIRPTSIRYEGVALRSESLAYVSVVINEREIWLPEFYLLRDRLLSSCPKCQDEEHSDLTIEAWWGFFEAAVRKAMDADVKESQAQSDDDSR